MEKFKLTFHNYINRVPDGQRTADFERTVEEAQRYNIDTQRIARLKKFEKTGSYYLTIQRIQ